jgi:four helix bundle protein
VNGEKAMGDSKGLEGLIVWRKSMDFAKRVYKEALPLLPDEEKWAMGSQLRRSAASIPANIAEGYGRHYYQEGVRYCYIARGSLEETRTFLTLSAELGYLPQDLHSALTNDLLELRRLISGYIAYLKKNKRGENEPGANSRLREIPTEYLTDLELEEPDY